MANCAGEIKESPIKVFIFNFRDVTSVEHSSHRDLVQMQQMIRQDKQSVVRICGLNPKVKKELVDMGIIREAEVGNNIRDIINELNND